MTIMADYALVALARSIAEEAHADQKRWGGEPYIIHPRAVAAAVAYLGPRFEAVGWLHDVIEDAPSIVNHPAWKTLPPDIVEAVEAISHKPDEPYIDYILRVKRNAIAHVVKQADINCNLADSDASTDKRHKIGGSSKDKYLMALWILEQE